jgi:hypothetical protein
LGLLGRTLPLEPRLQPFFPLVIFKVGSHFMPRIASTMILLCYASHWSWEDRYVLPRQLFSFEMGSHNLSSLDLPVTMNLLISASWRAWDDWCVPVHSAIG